MWHWLLTLPLSVLSCTLDLLRAGAAKTLLLKLPTLPFAIPANPSSPQHTDTSTHTHSRTSIQEPKGKGFPGKVTDQTETEQIPQRIYLCAELSAGSNPQFIKGNILLGSAWKEMISLVSGLCTVQNFWDAQLSTRICFQSRFDLWLTLHCSITAVGTVTAELDHCRQEESQGCWRMKNSYAQRWERTQGAGGHLTTLKKASVLLPAPCSLIPDLVQTHPNDANPNIYGIMPHTEFLKVSSTSWPWTSDAAQTS